MAGKGYFETFKNYAILATDEDIEKLPDRLRRLALIIREREGDITIREAAEALGLSAPTVSRLIKEWYSKNPGEMKDIDEKIVLAKAGEEGGRGRQAGSPSRRGSGGQRGGAPVQIEMGKSDVEVIEQIIKARLDTKYPIAAKLIRDVKWFTHVVLDAGIVATITAMRFLRPGEGLTFDDPERDVAVILAAINRMAGDAANAEALRQQVKALEEENRQLHTQLAEAEMERDELRIRMQRMEDAIRRAREAIDRLTEMVEAMMDILVRAAGQEAAGGVGMVAEEA